jgi:hypothetical protein
MLHLGEIAYAAEEAVRDSRSAARASPISIAASDVHRDFEDLRRSAHDDCERIDIVEIEAVHDAEARAQRSGEQTRARGRTDQREARNLDFERARGRTLADDDVDEKSSIAE